MHPDRKTIITDEQAHDSLVKFINQHFNKLGPKPRTQVPAHQDDDDLLLSDYISQQKTLLEAVRALYYAGVWTCDRPVNEVKLWTDLRDAAGFAPGQSPKSFSK